MNVWPAPKPIEVCIESIEPKSRRESWVETPFVRRSEQALETKPTFMACEMCFDVFPGLIAEPGEVAIQTCFTQCNLGERVAVLCPFETTEAVRMHSYQIDNRTGSRALRPNDDEIFN